MLSASGSGSSFKEKAQIQRCQPVEVESDSDLDVDDVESTPRQKQAARGSRMRRPSIRSSGSAPLLASAIHMPSTKSATSSSSSSRARSKSRPRPASSASSSRPARAPAPVPSSTELPDVQYDLSDEENLPSPFLRKIDRDRITRTTSVPANVVQGEYGQQRGRAAPRKSTNLRAVAVVNAAHAAGGTASSKSTGNLARAAAAPSRTVSSSAVGVRSSIAKAQRASEEARKTLFRG